MLGIFTISRSFSNKLPNPPLFKPLLSRKIENNNGKKKALPRKLKNPKKTEKRHSLTDQNRTANIKLLHIESTLLDKREELVEIENKLKEIEEKISEQENKKDNIVFKEFDDLNTSGRYTGSDSINYTGSVKQMLKNATFYLESVKWYIDFYKDHGSITLIETRKRAHRLFVILVSLKRRFVALQEKKMEKGQ